MKVSKGAAWYQFQVATCNKLQDLIVDGGPFFISPH